MKTTTSSELTLRPNIAGIASYRWLYSAIREQILKGRLRTGTKLPATRDLALQYGLARGTIVNAFEQLKAEGYVEGSIGSGTYVSRSLPEELLVTVRNTTEKASAPRKARIQVSGYAQRCELFSGYEDTPARAFRCNLPALDLFPIELWTQVVHRCLRKTTTRLLRGCDAFGYLPLREALAEYLGVSRGVNCVAGQVAIVSGVQEALDITTRVLLDPGDRVCVEDPGYPGASLVFRASGAKVLSVPVDNEGLCVARLPPAPVRLVYVTPGHQFPSGVTMSLTRRLQLLEWAGSSGALIFEDDYDSEYRFSGRPIPALQGLDLRGQVIYAGSFSKVLFPSLRLGYMVLPEALIAKVEALKSIMSRHAPLLEQVALDRFIRDGHFGRHIRRMRRIYAERLSILLDEARVRLAGLLEMSEIEAGLQTTGWLRCGVNSGRIAQAAALRGVEVTPLKTYSLKRSAEDALQFGFAAVDAREIRRGVRELGTVIHEHIRHKSRES